MVEFIQRHFLPTIVSSVEGLDFHTCMKRKKKKNYACSENHKLPAKTTNSLHEIKEKYATLVPNTVKLLYRQTKKAQSESPTEYQKEERSHKETGVPASNKQEHAPGTDIAELS